MTEEWRRYIAELLARAEARNHLLSNACKAYRERLTCAMFLRALGVAFSREELISVPDDGPPDYIDVTVQGARFQVRDLPEPGYRRQAEAKARAGELKVAHAANTEGEDAALLGYPSPYVGMSYAEAYQWVTEALAKKASSYGAPTCAKLDALVHMQLHWRYLDRNSPPADYATLLQQGWRSVSFLFRSTSHVIYAQHAAPAFLRQHTGQTGLWSGEDGFYNL